MQTRTKPANCLERLRWPDGAICPHCKNDGKSKPNSKLTPKAGSKSAVRKGVYFCGACRKQFTVTVKTVFEGSHIPISKWLMAWFIVCSSKKSVSAHQLASDAENHIQSGVVHGASNPFCVWRGHETKLTGTVEVDETFVGGKGEAKTNFSRHVPVVALIERGGKMQNPRCVQCFAKESWTMFWLNVWTNPPS